MRCCVDWKKKNDGYVHVEGSDGGRVCACVCVGVVVAKDVNVKAATRTVRWRR